MSASDRWLDPATEFEALYLQEYDKVLNFLRNIAPGEAEDLAQETFLKAYKARLTYIPKAPPGAWLIRIARNAALTFLRRRMLGDLPLADRHCATDKGFALADDRDELATLGSHLRPHQAKVLQLRYEEGLKLHEMVIRLHVSYATVSYRMRTALASLRAAV